MRPSISASAARWLAPLASGYLASSPFHDQAKGVCVLLILAIILFIIAIAGGIIIHPLLFILAIVALVVFFADRRRV
ncbi:MAG: hypothetical protein WAK93_13200 [Solirubrobacteraceae bacterium]